MNVLNPFLLLFRFARFTYSSCCWLSFWPVWPPGSWQPVTTNTIQDSASTTMVFPITTTRIIELVPSTPWNREPIQLDHRRDALESLMDAHHRRRTIPHFIENGWTYLCIYKGLDAKKRIFHKPPRRCCGPLHPSFRISPSSTLSIFILWQLCRQQRPSRTPRNVSYQAGTSFVDALSTSDDFSRPTQEEINFLQFDSMLRCYDSHFNFLTTLIEIKKRTR